jgi:nucleotide-binding universal stress UspA family protein
MPLLRCILFAADFSESSKGAFRVACSLADETKTRVFVLHVVEQVHAVEQQVAFGELGMPVVFPVESPAREDELKERLRECYAPDRPVDIEYRVTYGLIPEEILRTADEVGSDLIAMGTHGRTGLLRLLAGSVAEAVLRRARCPVLALSSRQHPEEGQIQVILHPTDFSERSEAALRVARALARDLGARLILLHVMPVEVVVYGTIPVPLDVPAVRDSLESVRNGVDGPDLKYPVETRLSEGNAAAVILRMAEEAGCGMIVMGTHGRRGFDRAVLGSVAESVLRDATCPVLVVKVPHRDPVPPPGQTAETVASAPRRLNPGIHQGQRT